MSELRETDMAAIASAVRILNEAGLDVEKTNHAKKGDQGVAFKLNCRAYTVNEARLKELELVKEAAIDAPDVDGLTGEVIDE